MLKKPYTSLKIIVLGFGLLLQNDIAYSQDLIKYVNPLIGTAPATTISAVKHGGGTENNAQVVPFVTVPFGMTNWTPQTKDTEVKCTAPYYYSDTKIQGFRGSHWLSGSCVQDYGTMTIMPVSGILKTLPTERGSFFDHKNEYASPNLYKVHLNDYDIDVAMTATKRAGLFKFIFNKSGESHIVINPNSDEAQGYIEIIPERNEIVGYNPVHRIYQGKGEYAGFKGYFVVRLNSGLKDFGVYKGNELFKGISKIADAKDIGAFLSFNAKQGEIIYANIGTSFTSIDDARKNLDAETNQLTFDDAQAKLKQIWENQLGKIKVEGKNEEDKVKFYTALYHSFLHPRTYNNVDGTYPSFGGGTTILNSGDNDYFDDYSMWDTYRAVHPLINLLNPKNGADMVNSLFRKAEQGGWLPIFPCWNSYTSAMIGDHAIAAIADAYSKDLITISDEDYAYLLKNAFESPKTFEEYKSGKGRRALPSYLKFGYVPLEDKVEESFHKGEQVSRTLEYAFDDFALSRIAEKKGDLKNSKILLQRALNYKNVFSKEDLSVRGRYENGTFLKDFDKTKKQPSITEGTPWQYTWYVPQDINGLIQLMGGKGKFNENLDKFFTEGQYWHGNEPGHQVPFLYNYSGQPWKTQQKVTEIMTSEYGIGPGGLSGNDDAGQMSAWYVFAAIGFYPVAPSVPEYVISGPHFDQIIMTVGNGKELKIIAKGASEGKNYIKSVTINGKVTDKNYLNHFELIKGGTIEFEMTSKPNTKWGTSADSTPFSISKK